VTPPLRDVVGAAVPTPSRLFPVSLAPPVAAAPQLPTGSTSGGSMPPRSVPAINSSGAFPSGMNPDFIPK
jgi:hypothetical protein